MSKKRAPRTKQDMRRTEYAHPLLTALQKSAGTECWKVFGLHRKSLQMFLQLGDIPKKWDQQQVLEFRTMLQALLGKFWEELFPCPVAEFRRYFTARLEKGERLRKDEIQFLCSIGLTPPEPEDPLEILLQKERDLEGQEISFLSQVSPTLTRQQAKILYQRFFLELSLKKVGRKFRKTHEWVRQLQNQGLRKLRFQSTTLIERLG